MKNNKEQESMCTNKEKFYDNSSLQGNEKEKKKRQNLIKSDLLRTDFKGHLILSNSTLWFIFH